MSINTNLAATQYSNTVNYSPKVTPIEKTPIQERIAQPAKDITRNDITRSIATLRSLLSNSTNDYESQSLEFSICYMEAILKTNNSYLNIQEAIIKIQNAEKTLLSKIKSYCDVMPDVNNLEELNTSLTKLYLAESGIETKLKIIKDTKEREELEAKLEKCKQLITNRQSLLKLYGFLDDIRSCIEDINKMKNGKGSYENERVSWVSNMDSFIEMRIISMFKKYKLSEYLGNITFSLSDIQRASRLIEALQIRLNYSLEVINDLNIVSRLMIATESFNDKMKIGEAKHNLFELGYGINDELAESLLRVVSNMYRTSNK